MFKIPQIFVHKSDFKPISNSLSHQYIFRSWPVNFVTSFCDGSSSRVGGGKKHEIYVTAKGGHLFLMTYFYRARGHGPLAPWIPLLPSQLVMFLTDIFKKSKHVYLKWDSVRHNRFWLSQPQCWFCRTFIQQHAFKTFPKQQLFCFHTKWEE